VSADAVCCGGWLVLQGALG